MKNCDWLSELTKYKVPTLESLNIITLKHYCEESMDYYAIK